MYEQYCLLVLTALIALRYLQMEQFVSGFLISKHQLATLLLTQINFVTCDITVIQSKIMSLNLYCKILTKKRDGRKFSCSNTIATS